MTEISFASTGNEADDEELARRIQLHNDRMQLNICPNGCGQMRWIDAHNRECEKCRFAGFSMTPYDMKAASA